MMIRKIILLGILLLNLHPIFQRDGKLTVSFMTIVAQNFGNEYDDDDDWWGNGLPEVEIIGDCTSTCRVCGASIPCSEISAHESSCFLTGQGGGNNEDRGNSDDNSGNGDDNIPTVGGSGDSSNTNLSNIVPMKTLRNNYNVNLTNRYNLPDKFPPQDKGTSQCTARAIANSRLITDGVYTYDAAYLVAKNYGHQLNIGGIQESEICKTYENYGNLVREPYSTSLIESYIDINTPVLAIMDRPEGPHMVTIFGYDDYYYYCAAGLEDPQKYTKEQFRDHSIFTFITSKPPYKCKEQ